MGKAGIIIAVVIVLVLVGVLVWWLVMKKKKKDQDKSEGYAGVRALPRSAHMAASHK